MVKRNFSSAERFAVWLHHGKRCWLCLEPLRLAETTIDHLIPEILLEEDSERERLFAEYGLSSEFNINGFENWLPCHGRCNQKKGRSFARAVPANLFVLERLLKVAPAVCATARAICQNVGKDKVLAKVSVALEDEQIVLNDLQDLISQIGGDGGRLDRASMVKLENGYWVAKEDIVLEAECRCERKSCVGLNGKITCIFSAMLSDWVTKTGLYWKCYDELIVCPRCKRRHKRGHTGALDICGRPYLDQQNQKD